MKQPPESAEFFKALVENSLDAVAVVEANGTIRYESPSVERILGYKPEELIGKNALDFLHPEDVKRVAGNITTAQENPERAFSSGVRFLHKDGTWRVLEGIGCNLLHDPKVNGIVTNYRDITERKRYEEALRESEEKYRSIIADIEDGYYEVDIAGNFTFFNDPMCGIIGYSKDEMMGMNNRQYMDKENAHKVYQAFNLVYATGKHSKEFDWEIIRKDGTKRFIEASVSLKRNSEGKPIGFRGIARDITERKRLEEELHRLGWAVQSTSDGVGIADVTGKSIYHNEALVEMLGYTVDELNAAGGPPAVYADPDVAREMFDTIMKGGSWNREMEMKTRTGRDRVVHLRADSVKNENGRIIGLIGIHADFTERKQAEETLRQSEERFRQIFNDVNDGIVYTDTDGVVLNVNEKIGDVVGYPPDELIGRNVLELDLFDPDELSKLSEIMMASKEQGSVQRPLMEVQARHRDGQLVPLEVSTSLITAADGTTKGFVSIARDITERKRMEDSLWLKEDAIENSLGAIAMS
ncbi:MAG: PAS domain-containing protein, partial [Dehalococcoidia bacterium]|nr:PAS domain-containing protein [Dehalococcoidia bacterium]